MKSFAGMIKNLLDFILSVYFKLGLEIGIGLKK